MACCAFSTSTNPISGRSILSTATSRRILDDADPKGDAWPPLSDSEQDLLIQIPILRARFAVEGRRAEEAPQLDWKRLAALPIDPTTDDLSALLAAAHQHQDTQFFANVAEAMRGWPVPMCPRPKLPAPAPDLLAPLLCGADNLYALTWAASLATMSDRRFEDVVAAMGRSERVVASGNEEVSALVVLGIRDRERFDALGVLGAHPSFESGEADPGAARRAEVRAATTGT